VTDRLVRFPGASWDEIETVTVHEGQEIISVQHISLDT
jgi:hypothetical protein